jgi:hypothetical protein
MQGLQIGSAVAARPGGFAASTVLSEALASPRQLYYDVRELSLSLRRVSSIMTSVSGLRSPHVMVFLSDLVC